MENMDYSRFFQALDYGFLPGLLLKVGILVTLAAGLAWYFQKARGWILFVAFILLMRVALFENPLAWYTYARMLKFEDVGYRDASYLTYRLSQYERHEPIRLLAMGSSQMGASFLFRTELPTDVKTQEMAGMSPVDLYFMRHEIAKLNPQYLLLYLSDFDLGRTPGFKSLRTLPAQGWELPHMLLTVPAQFQLDDSARFALFEGAVGELFPEYKHNFIFKGYLEMFCGRKNAKPEASETNFSPAEGLRNQLTSLQNLSEKPMSGNLYCLQQLAEFLQAHGIQIIIAEGQYRPDVYGEYNQVTRDKAAAGLQELAHRNPNVTFIPRQNLRYFSVEDYRDYYHVTREPALEFTEQLIKLLPEEARPQGKPSGKASGTAKSSVGAAT